MEPPRSVKSLCCCCEKLEVSSALYGRRRDALPTREPRASGRDDPHGGAEGAKGHGQKDALLLSELPAGVTGGWRKDHRVRLAYVSSKLALLLHFRLTVVIFLSSAGLRAK